MPDLRATLLVEVRGLWVKRDALGFKFSVTRDGCPVTVELHSRAERLSVVDTAARATVRGDREANDEWSR
jgi:hypothetical protein